MIHIGNYQAVSDGQLGAACTLLYVIITSGEL